MTGMYSRLRYLHHEGFEICAIMGYDSVDVSPLHGVGSILYRVKTEEDRWRVVSECFDVTHHEMEACSGFYVHYVLRRAS